MKALLRPEAGLRRAKIVDCVHRSPKTKYNLRKHKMKKPYFALKRGLRRAKVEPQRIELCFECVDI